MRHLWATLDDQVDISVENAPCIGAAAAIAAVAATWAVREVAEMHLPFLFCVAAVVLAAMLYGFAAAAIATVLSLIGTVALAAGEHPLVNTRNVTLIALICLCLGACGETIRRLRAQVLVALRNAARRERVLELFFGESPAVTLVIDESEQIVAASEATYRLMGLSHRDVIGKTVKRYLGENNVGAEKKTVMLEDGRILHLRTTTVPMEIAERRFAIIYVRDETAMVQASEELAMVQRELHQMARATSLGQLGSSIAHELNQPLAFVANYVGAARAMLDRPQPDVVKAKAAIDDALAQVFRASSVLKNLRGFAARRSPARHWIDARDALGEAIRLGSFSALEARATLKLDLADELGEVLIDQVQFQQVVLNLITNAADAVRARDDRRIAVRAWVDYRKMLRISIEDSGDGVPDHLADLAFAPFQSTKSNGVGIGLAICRTIVEAHGGSISHDRDTSLGGARFVFSVKRRSTGG